MIAKSASQPRIIKYQLSLMVGILHGGIVDIYFDILPVVAESFAEDCETANMFRIIVHSHAEAEAAAVIQIEAVDGHIRDLQAIDESALFVDH